MHVCARVLGALACEVITTIHHCTQRKEFNYGQKRIPRIPGEDAERGGSVGKQRPPVANRRVLVVVGSTCTLTGWGEKTNKNFKQSIQ